MENIEDPIKELEAKKEVYDCLKDLDKAQQGRVWRWIGEVLDLQPGGNLKQMPLKGTVTPMLQQRGYATVSTLSEYSSAAEVLGTAGVSRDNERTLLVAAFLQEKLNKEELTGNEIAEELKNVGHQLSNVTSTIATLANRKPAWMIQLRKDGKTKQARKKYKVTTEGLKQALVLLSGSHGTEEAA